MRWAPYTYRGRHSLSLPVSLSLPLSRRRAPNTNRSAGQRSSFRTDRQMLALPSLPSNHLTLRVNSIATPLTIFGYLHLVGGGGVLGSMLRVVYTKYGKSKR